MPNELEQFEDPLVCSNCQGNQITILDREEKQVYCHRCERKTEWFDKSLLPHERLAGSINFSTTARNGEYTPSCKEIYEDWKKGEQLTEKHKKILRETRYRFIWILNHKKHTSQDSRKRAKQDKDQIEEWMNTMEVDYSERPEA